MERARKMILVPEDMFQPAQSASSVLAAAAVDETPSKEPDVGKKVYKQLVIIFHD